jgi:hypothetical protein
MPTFEVELSQRMSVTVQVDAPDADAAVHIVNRRDYELPPRDTWTANKDGYIRVYDKDGDIAAETEF